MKSSLVSFVLILSITTLIAQTSSNSDLNSPGEKIENSNIYSNSLSQKEQVQKLRDNIEQDAEKIKSLYFIEKEVFVAYADASQKMTQELKKHIFKAGQILIEHNELAASRVSENNFGEQLRYLKEISKIQDQLEFFSKQKKTRPIEKKLKKLKTAEEIYPIFFAEHPITKD